MVNVTSTIMYSTKIFRFKILCVKLLKIYLTRLVATPSHKNEHFFAKPK